jgi:pyruvate formate lyase activating enzyme
MEVSFMVTSVNGVNAMVESEELGQSPSQSSSVPASARATVATATQNYPTKYWHMLPNGRVQCDLCPQACKLNEGQRGLCFVRMRENNQVVLTTFGRSSGFAIDPIEKKPLYHFLPGTEVYSFGTVGCNLACRFCQNWDISKAREMDRLAAFSTPEVIAATAEKYNCPSVAFTYNEPNIFMEYAVETAKECHKRNIKAVAVTNGYICPAPRAEFYSHMDAVRVDLKGFTEDFYKRLTGSSLQPVLDTLVYAKHESKAWLEIITLLIPGENDSAQEIDAMTKWVAANIGLDTPHHFTAFHPAWKLLDKPSTPLETLVRAREIAMSNGLRYVYTGNIYYPEGECTYCHNCKKVIIERAGYTLGAYNLDKDGNCKFCHTHCAGVFAGVAR